MEPTQHKHSELPEPIRRVYTEEERLRRRWRLWRVVLMFLACYSLIHKLIIPLSLKFTVLRLGPYSKIDPMFLYLLVLYYSFRPAVQLTGFLSFLAGIGIAHGCAELVLVSLGYTVGWLAISHLLSSLPLALVCTILMSQRKLGRQLKSAWVGALIYSLFALVAGGRR